MNTPNKIAFISSAFMGYLMIKDDLTGVTLGLVWVIFLVCFFTFIETRSKKEIETRGMEEIILARQSRDVKILFLIPIIIFLILYIYS